MMSVGQLLSGALDANLEHQLARADVVKYLSKEQWLREYGTIRLSTARQTGKTSAIARMATSRDLVVVYGQAMAHDFKARTSFNPVIVTPRALEEGVGLRGFQFDRVWVDEATFTLRSNDLDNVYASAVMNGAKQVILVG
jgi:hypothetical protein